MRMQLIVTLLRYNINNFLVYLFFSFNRHSKILRAAGGDEERSVALDEAGYFTEAQNGTLE